MSSKPFFLIFALFFFQYGCDTKEFNEEIFCDVESVTNNKINSNNGKYSFKWVQQKTDKKSYSGKYSIKLYNGQPYGLSIKLSDILPDYYINANVKVHDCNSSCCIIIEGENDGEFLIKFKNISTIDENGWVQLSGEAFIPASYKGNSIKLYVYNNDSNYAYFDDLKIIIKSKKDYPVIDNKIALNIDIDNSAFNNLVDYRNIAINSGIISKSEKNKEKITIRYNNDKINAKLRLKGDWLDHLQGDKWSYRINISSNNSFNGMISFSLQSPICRDFLNEWVAHKFFEKEDVLTTRYGFIPLLVNEKSNGIYAYEENFEKQLLESKNRREGIILKLSEDFLWQIRLCERRNNVFNVLPYFHSCDILPFQLSKILKNPNLKNQFQIAQNLITQYKFGLKKSSDVFDIDKLARFYAICDITKCHHALIWHNLRFYYNPVISKLEPIAFDGYTESGPFILFQKPFIGMVSDKFVGNDEWIYLFQCFNDKKFVALYYKYLNIYSSENYLNNFFNQINIELNNYEKMIQEEYNYYSYDRNFLKNNARVIKDSLKNFDYNNIQYSYKIYDKTKFNKLSNDFDTFLVKAYTEQIIKNKEQIVKIINYQPEKISIIEGSNLNYKKEFKIELEEFQPNIKNNLNNITLIILPVDYNRIKIKNISSGNQYYINIRHWQSPSNDDVGEQLISAEVFKNYFRIEKDTILFFKSNISIVSNNIVIPKGYLVYFNEGTVINFINNSIFVSHSPIRINGTTNKPVIIKSSDNSANGFSILQANSKSIINNAIFDGLNTLDYKGWTLTGAVNFYESDVEITNTSFINNVCEDGLNIIRSKFIVKDSKFENTFGDAFDSDFSTGIVDGCKFENTNNDAIDFSGSNVEIFGCNISKAKDKGVSGGEKSILYIKNLSISDCNIGIASKDKSLLTVENTIIKNSNYGFVLLQKKTEYGDAEVKATNITLENNKTEYLIEKGSAFSLNGNKINGTEKKLAKQFYQ